MNDEIYEQTSLRWYTFPPIPYPYILVNAIRPHVETILSYKNYVKSIIIDSGVEIFRDPSIKDYPSGHVMRIIKLYHKITKLFPHVEVFATIPDYPDDYHPKNLWLNENYTNIERTVDNIILYIEKFKINWLIPIQGWNKNPESVSRSIKLLSEHGIINEYDYFAVANLCVEPNKRLIFETVRNVRSLLPHKKIHVFGLKLNAIPLVANYINSFDSMGWTRPVSTKLKKEYGNYSCKNKEERIAFFIEWYNKLRNYLSQESLVDYL